MTQEEMAEKMNIKNETISRIEKDKNIPTVENIVKFSDVLGCSTDEILKGTNKENVNENGISLNNLNHIQINTDSETIKELITRINKLYDENSRLKDLLLNEKDARIQMYMSLNLQKIG